VVDNAVAFAIGSFWCLAIVAVIELYRIRKTLEEKL